MPRKMQMPSVPDVPEWDASNDKFSGSVMSSHEDDEELPYSGTGRQDLGFQVKRKVEGEIDDEDKDLH